ncbi:MAG: glutathione synthase, partial [Gammaproteobacteria bacterium]|nr:glutathione synthase [Gammaproteobacteria bacterium]
MAALTSVFLIDPPERLDPPTDTSLALMRESQRRGHRVFFTTLDGLRLEDDRVCMKARPAAFAPERELFDAGDERELTAADCDIVYMRKDPPVDAAYIQATWILGRLPRRVLQINPAEALRNYCEKLIPLELPGLLPPTVMSRDPGDLAAFLQRMEHIVVKPLDDCSGRG